MPTSPLDREILQVGFTMSKTLGEQLRTETVRARLSDFSDEDFYDSLETLGRQGLVSRSQEVAPRPPFFSLTWSGVIAQLESMRTRELIQLSVERDICKNPNSTLASISQNVHQSPLDVEAVLRKLEAAGDIRVLDTATGQMEIIFVSAELKRRAPSF
jgi:hypothetical protein